MTLAEELDNLEFSFDLAVPSQMLLEFSTEESIDDGNLEGVLLSEDYTVEQTYVAESKFDRDVSEIDKWDYAVSVGSAVLTSVLDILWIKDFSLEDAQNWGKNEADEIVKRIAKKNGYNGDDLNGAIQKLEKLFKIPADELTAEFGGGKQHHLRDFSHHASLLGLCFSVLTQFTGYGYGTDTDGKFVFYEVPTDEHIGKTFEDKMFNGVVTWFFHMISDFDGSSGSRGWGTGVPGPLLSFFKELSSLPVINEIKIKYKGQETKLPVIISKFFNGTFFPHETKEEIIRFDLRTEMGIFHQMGTQAVPIIANECIVRAFYALRRLSMQIKENNVSTLKELLEIDPKSFLPFNNRTVTRMITVSSGTFLLLVTSETAVNALVKNRGNAAGAVKSFILGINYPGVVRFVLACKADAKYLSEDMKNACSRFTEKHKKQYMNAIKTVPGTEYLTLSETQFRILASLERQKILYDIKNTKCSTHAAKKKLWLKEWLSSIEDSVGASDYFIRNEDDIYDAILNELSENDDCYWIYLLAFELGLFEPYYRLSENDKRSKGMKLKANYENDVFCKSQDIVDGGFFARFMKEYNKALGVLQKKNAKVIAGTAATLGAAALTGGAALYFAPEIAAIIAGDAVAGLYGAALTNASLAFVGGGALAAGGLGIAGGTAIITGGGALLGMVGTGMVSATSIMLLSSKDSILQGCAKLMAFSKCVLIEKYNKHDAVKTFFDSVNNGITDIKEEIESLENKLKNESDENSKQLKKMLKDSKTSLKYIVRCGDYLKKLTGDNS